MRQWNKVVQNSPVMTWPGGPCQGCWPRPGVLVKLVVCLRARDHAGSRDHAGRRERVGQRQAAGPQQQQLLLPRLLNASVQPA